MKIVYQSAPVKLYDTIRRCQLSADTPTLYYHTDCKQGMAIHWPDTGIASGMGYGLGATTAYCPRCGKLMMTDVNALNTFIYKHTTKVPTHAAFKLKEGGHVLDFSVYMELVTIDTEFNDIYRPQYGRKVTQTVRFDFNKQRTYIIEKVGRSSTMTEVDPFQDAKLLNLTALYYIRGCSHLADNGLLTELKAMAQQLKQLFARKLSKKVGYKVDLGRALMRTTSTDGLFTNLISQLAWRLAVPDGPVLNENALHQVRLLGSLAEIASIIDETRQGLPFYKAVIKVMGLDDNRIVRYGIATNLGNTPIVYRYVGEIFSNYDYRKQAFIRLVQLYDGPRYANEETKKLLVKLVNTWGEAYGLAVIKCYDWPSLRDIAYMIDQLAPTEWDRFTQLRRPRARDLHDALVRFRTRIEHQDGPIQRGQVYRDLEYTSFRNYKFKAPKQVRGIFDLADAMHNCVAKAYLPKVKRGECAIVAVMKNKKPVACLEVRKDDSGRWGVLQQARLRNNKMLQENQEVENAVQEWLKARRIENKDYLVRG